ncbi:MAG TPA: DHA2 family efflux MFS transporter permease subunit [Candidatus Paceibacterota bacterium]|nr:DHA2 family efflux MFS transporter permease subunit [Candidatus Paceibacterota bacterium]
MVLATVMVGTLLIGLDRTVVNLGLPGMIKDFGITVSDAAWIATAYIISNAVFVPVFGKLGDKFGNRTIYLWSFVAFIVISVAAGAAWNLSSMIVLRVFQGLVGAAIYPTAMALIAKTFTDPDARTQALGVWSASFAVSAVLGPLVGGPLIDNFSWRWLFYVNMPVGILGLFMTLWYLPFDRPTDHKHGFDYQGAATLGVSLSALVLVLERGREWGWLSAESLAAFVVAIVFGLLFYRVERRAHDPIVDLKLFSNPIFSDILILSFISFGGMMGAMFLLPVFAQTYLEYNATETGLLFVPMAFTMMLSAPLGGRLSRVVPLKYLVAFGMAVSAFGIFLFSGLDVRTSLFELMVPFVIFSFGLGLGMAPMTAAATNAVDPREIGVSSAVLNLVRNIGGAVGIAFFGTILSNLIESNVLDIAQSTVVRSADHSVLATVRMLIVLKAQVEAYGEVFFIASLVMGTGVLAAFLLKEPPKRPVLQKEADAGAFH